MPRVVVGTCARGSTIDGAAGDQARNGVLAYHGIDVANLLTHLRRPQRAVKAMTIS